MHYEDDQAEVHKVVVGPLATNVYALRCKKTGGAALVDAADDPDRLLALCRRLGVDKVVQTHGHWDHIQAVPQLRDAGLEVGVSAEDAPRLPSYDYVLKDDSLIEVGDLRLRTIFTPGHTPGSMCFLVEGAPVLFAGDTLFPGGPGKTRSRGQFDSIIRSIQDRLFAELDDDTIVMPGHGEDATVGSQRPHLAEWIERGW